MAAALSRWIVTYIEGYANADSDHAGASIHILDRRRNRRIVATFRSEDSRFRDALDAAKARLAELREIEP